jgi:acetyltransferase-like isoleucine patch superfamily enzyme/dTDP-4-dehydrorhamnose 3,5-epimerase-like enzyme
MSVFVHPQALCESLQVGDGTRVWAFAHVLAKARIGADCNICDHVFIEDDVVVGDRVTVKCGVQLWNGVRLEDDVFVGPNATFTNDRFPRSRRWLAECQETIVRKGASIGANATILPGLVIGEAAMVGAGAVVTRGVPANAIVAGNPARIVGYVDSVKSAQQAATAPRPHQPHALQVRGVALYELPTVRDLRGSLAVAELEQHVPFTVRRCFMVFDVPSADVRGEHAHRVCHQFMLCVHGHCRVMVDDGQTREEVQLDRPSLALHVPPLVWGTQYRYSTDAVLVVFASHPYDPQDYIRDYGVFREEVRPLGR